jgi:hypothetical protein
MWHYCRSLTLVFQQSGNASADQPFEPFQLYEDTDAYQADQVNQVDTVDPCQVSRPGHWAAADFQSRPSTSSVAVDDGDVHMADRLQQRESAAIASAADDATSQAAIDQAAHSRSIAKHPVHQLPVENDPLLQGETAAGTVSMNGPKRTSSNRSKNPPLPRRSPTPGDSITVMAGAASAA